MIGLAEEAFSSLDQYFKSPIGGSRQKELVLYIWGLTDALFMRIEVGRRALAGLCNGCNTGEILLYLSLIIAEVPGRFSVTSL